MVDRKLSPTFWIALGAVATLMLAAVAVVQWVFPYQNTGPPALTATIESFRYRHAETDILGRREEWREKWLQPFENKLKERSIAPELLETVVAAMEEMINEKIERESQNAEFSIARSRKWYSVTIRNDGDKPLKDVFLKFPAADYWIAERGRLTWVPQRIEIGDMDQRSEKWFTLWGNRLGSISGNDEAVLGHSTGIGTIDFD